MFDLDADGFMKPASAGVLPKLPSGTTRPPKPMFVAYLEPGVTGVFGLMLGSGVPGVSVSSFCLSGGFWATVGVVGLEPVPSASELVTGFVSGDPSMLSRLLATVILLVFNSRKFEAVPTWLS